MDDVKSKIVELDLNDILPNRFQPRIKFNEESIIELSDSIKEHGVIQPIIVRPIGDKYEIVAGERRYKACVLSGLDKIPARILDLNDKDSAEVALIENVQREGLTPIEEAISYKKILDMGYITQEQLARKLGRSQSTIANKKRLLNLCDEVQEALMDEKISERHARSLLKLTNVTDQQSMLKRIIAERLTVRRLDDEIEKFLNGDTSALETREKSELIKEEKNNSTELKVEKKEEPAKESATENSLIDISDLFDESVVSSNSTLIYDDIKNRDNLNITNLFNSVKEEKEIKEDGMTDTMFIENKDSNFEFNNSANNRKMSMNDILMTESSKHNNLNNDRDDSTSGGTSKSMFNNLMNQNASQNPDNYIDAETFKNYLDPAYIDGQKQIEPQNKGVIDSSVFAKFLDPEYNLSNNQNPVKDQFAKNEPTISTMSFADYLNSDKKATEIPVAQPQANTNAPSTNMKMDDLLAPTILNSVPEIKVNELPIVVPSEIPKEEPVVEEVKQPVVEKEPPVMVMATDLSSLSVPEPSINTSELLTSSPVNIDASLEINKTNVSNSVKNDVTPAEVISTLATPDNKDSVINDLNESKHKESEISMQEDVKSIIPKDYDVGTENKDVKPDLLAPIGSPINSSLGKFNPNKTIEQLTKENEELQRRLYEQATAPLTPDFSTKEEKEEEPKAVQSTTSPADKPIFVTATQTNVSSLTTSPIIDNPELSNLLKKEEPQPVVEEKVVEEPEPVVEPTVVNPSIGTLDTKPIIVTDYNKQYDPVLPDINMPVKPQIELKEVINMIRKLDSQIEALGFSIDTEEYDLEDYYQVVFKIDKK